MAIILCLETATTNCSVALSVNGSVIALKEDKTPGYSHAEKLHVFIEEVLKGAAIKKDNIDAIAVSEGPGSYTGLRIGVSAAKGLSFALDVPLIAIPTLEVLANAVNEEGIIIPLLDARRMEVYASVYDRDKKEIRETRAEILTEDSFKEYISDNKTYFTGNGVDKFKPLVTNSNAVFLENKLPSSKEMAELAEKKFKTNDFEDVAYFEPYYLKAFRAG